MITSFNSKYMTSGYQPGGQITRLSDNGRGLILRDKTTPLCCTRRLWRSGDVMTFESLTLTPFWFREIQCKKRDIFMFKRRFQCVLGWNQVK